MIFCEDFNLKLSAVLQLTIVLKLIQQEFLFADTYQHVIIDTDG